MKKTVIASVVSSTLALTAVGSAAAEDIKESVYPSVNGSPVTLMNQNLITQKLGGRLLNLDIWAGEFIRHDDNVFNTKSEKKSDTIYTTAAGFLLQAKQAEQWSLKAEGQFQRNNYKSLKAYNGNEGFFHANGSYTFSPALTARLSAGYDRSYDRVREEKDIYSNSQYRAGAGVTISPSPFFDLDADYRFFAQRRKQDLVKYTEYDDHTFALRPSYKITPNTKVYFEASVSKVDTKGNWYTDSTNYGGVFGLAWQYRDTATLYGEAGVVSMHFDNNSNAGSQLDYQDKSKTLPKVRVGGTLAISTDWKLNGEISYAPQVGATTTSARNSAYVKSLTVAGGVLYSPGAGRFTAKFTPYVSNTKPSNSMNEEFREYGATLGLSYSVFDWLNVSAGYRYTNTKYKNDSSYDRQQFMLGAAITL
jgi:hypothetical protein